MAKKIKSQNMGIIIAIAVGALVLMNMNQPAPEAPNNGGNGGLVDLCTLVDPTGSFTGKRMFLFGTSLTTEYVRVFERNSGEELDRDLGLISMDGGTVSVAAEGIYDLYWGENSTTGSSATYYTNVEQWIVPCQEGTVHKSVELCYADTDPSVTIYDENGQVQNAATNEQSFGTDDEKTLQIKIDPASDKCYGNPTAEGDNAVCYLYNTTVFADFEMPGLSTVSVPYAISSAYSTAGYAITCFGFAKITDNAEVLYDLVITSAGTAPVDSRSNISIYLNDVAFDLDGDELTEIWGFEDEDNNELGAAVVAGDSISVT